MASAICYFSSCSTQTNSILADTLGRQCLPCRKLGGIKEADACGGLGLGRKVPSPPLFISPGLGLTRGSLGPCPSDPLGLQGEK